MQSVKSRSAAMRVPAWSAPWRCCRAAAFPTQARERVWEGISFPSEQRQQPAQR
jgi:hypothetical protein